MAGRSPLLSTLVQGWQPLGPMCLIYLDLYPDRFRKMGLKTSELNVELPQDFWVAITTLNHQLTLLLSAGQECQEIPAPTACFLRFKSPV